MTTIKANKGSTMIYLRADTSMRSNKVASEMEAVANEESYICAIIGILKHVWNKIVSIIGLATACSRHCKK
jgi:hypothetical protein